MRRWIDLLGQCRGEGKVDDRDLMRAVSSILPNWLVGKSMVETLVLINYMGFPGSIFPSTISNDQNLAIPHAVELGPTGERRCDCHLNHDKISAFVGTFTTFPLVCLAWINIPYSPPARFGVHERLVVHSGCTLE